MAAKTLPRIARRWQYSFATLLLVVTFLGIFLGVLANRAREQRTARKLILSLGGTVAYDFEVDDEGQRITDPPNPLVPNWIRGALGDDFLFRIVYVDLGGTGVSDEDLRRISCLDGLMMLSLKDTAITDDGFETIRLSDIRLLDVQFAHNLTDKTLSRIKVATQLRWLGATYTKIGDATIEAISGHQQLHTLVVGATKLTDDGLKCLTTLKSLEILSIDNCEGVTDHGLPHLHGLAKLTSLICYNTNATSDGIEALRDALPKCEIRAEIPWHPPVLETVSEPQEAPAW
jgi:hypothetical protein